MASQPEGLLYQSSKYMSFLTVLLDCEQASLLALDNSDAVIGALPLMAQNGALGRVFNSLPYYGSNGGILGNKPLVASALVEAYHALLDAPATAAGTVIENPLSATGLSTLRHDLTDERIGQFTPISYASDHADVLMESFHYKTRNMIRKAAKLGVSVEVDNTCLDFLERTHTENMSEIGGIAKSPRFFELLPSHFEPDRDYRIYVSRLENQPVAAVLAFYFNKTVEYYTPVVSKEFRETQALSAAIYLAMCDASRSGMHWWNWGGTWLSQDGVYRFKKRWGTKDMPYRYFTTICNPKLLHTSRHQLLEDYPSFYTAPFSALQT